MTAFLEWLRSLYLDLIKIKKLARNLRCFDFAVILKLFAEKLPSRQYFSNSQAENNTQPRVSETSDKKNVLSGGLCRYVYAFWMCVLFVRLSLC